MNDLFSVLWVSYWQNFTLFWKICEEICILNSRFFRILLKLLRSNFHWKIAFSTKTMFSLRYRQSDILSSMNPCWWHRRQASLTPAAIYRRCHGIKVDPGKFVTTGVKGHRQKICSRCKDAVYRRRQQPAVYLELQIFEWMWNIFKKTRGKMIPAKKQS
jgi:hypothetical protein